MRSATLVLTLIAFFSLFRSSSANAAPQVGLMVGSDSGINVKIDDYKIGVGFDELSFTMDRTFNFQDNPNFYWGLGGKIADSNKDDIQLAARAVFGAHAKVERFTFFAEAQPTLYILDDVKVKLEAIAGVRYHF
ncbi:hypothetical protein [Shewanella sp. UCD-KL21]|uniref:hypothetical protein n=1 Tax=Shewanella sp. UCD-KL21 TaxID=1917164 RepID=UPI00097074E3|nr:hypothetical protein [Shewanella sp. UCD-KL21]